MSEDLFEAIFLTCIAAMCCVSTGAICIFIIFEFFNCVAPNPDEERGKK